MTTSLCVFVNSYWSSEDMNPTTTALSLLTHDLMVRSSGSSGRHLFERLDDRRLDLLGAEGPLQFAAALQDSSSVKRQVLEDLLRWTPQDNDFLLIALVALSRDLESIALRLTWGRPSSDTISEVLAQATVALRWTHELAKGDRVDFVLDHALAKTRNEQRRTTRHNVPTTFIPDDYDVAESEFEPFEAISSLLDRAVENRVICERDAELIRRTRGEKTPLREIAREFNTSYDALRMRRARAEASLRRHFPMTDLR